MRASALRGTRPMPPQFNSGPPGRSWRSPFTNTAGDDPTQADEFEAVQRKRWQAYARFDVHDDIRGQSGGPVDSQLHHLPSGQHSRTGPTSRGDRTKPEQRLCLP
jgi:hypothetical protein